MTNEEAIKRLKSDIYKCSDFTENPNENEFWTAFDMAINALKQESVLDKINKIRAEIEQTAKDYDKFDDYRRVRGLWIALEIIDKYKAESEVQE